MSYLRPPSPYETAPIVEGSAPRLDLGRVIGRSFAIIRRRWLVLGFFLLVYFVIDWTFDALWPFRDKSGVHDWRLALSLAVYLGFSCLQSLRDTALTATALQATPSPSSVWSSIANASRTALRAFPVLLPFIVFLDLPGLVEALWRRWSPLNLPFGRLAELLLATSLGELVFSLAVIGAWGVVVPTVIVEQAGLFASVQRAWRLLSGSRWRLIAIFVVVTVIAALPSALAAAFMRPIYDALHLNGRPRDAFRAELEVAGALGSIVGATWQVMIGVTYLELRRVKEGVVEGEVADVFA